MMYFLYYLEPFIEVLLFLFALIVLIAFFSKKKRDHHGHWNTLIDNFSFSTKKFYELLKQEMKAHGIEDLYMKEVEIQVNSVLSEYRLYLRMEWKNIEYEVCAAPFAHGFFVSWWLSFNTSFVEILIEKIPFIGGWLTGKLYPITYYKLDTASMFMSYAQSSVVKVIDDITQGQKGVRSLSESERKPNFHELLKR